MLPVVGGGERVVVASWPAPVTELAWSPNGAHIAFVARVPDPEHYGPVGQKRKVEDMPARHISHLLFQLDSEGWVVDRPNRVMTVPADGSTSPRALTTGPYEASGITWSPDGSRIVFASARHETWDLDGAVDLWTIAADGSGDPERLTDTKAVFSLPSWSPDGSKIAYVRNPDALDDPRHEQIGVLDLSNRATTELTTDLDRNCLPYGYGRAPVWFGDRLLCSVEDSGNVHVYAVPISGDSKPFAVVTGERWVNVVGLGGRDAGHVRQHADDVPGAVRPAAAITRGRGAGAGGRTAGRWWSGANARDGPDRAVRGPDDAV